MDATSSHFWIRIFHRTHYSRHFGFYQPF
ncbi:hypothetical protein D049_4147A, partial [Vibrio parahaemolyticus VPTS-2010]